ncbi:amidohydrolase [Spongiibacter sp. KMU-166]|uniref:Amidohydrolase n=1 Tax=Spongiibacter thalassae TaxID=2721624 RepID=A0ABX1GA23_9GAMM|nr:N(2)-acetyl-L-2,4-diaminobutanoate deacetylase DoeB2 [Spongiibacter thalassae]NKI15795.1 amidohydrolase [Spongiibacter thalassae]
MPDQWQNIMVEAQRLRHELHQYPELGWKEDRTAERIRRELDQLTIPWRPCAGTGTVAYLAAGAKGKHIALRGDIDALPIHEQSGRDWASRHEGCMHACGHDGHTASLLATAAWLKQHEAQLAGPVTLIFQPAEEGGHGAREMIADGALDKVDEIFGWHNWPALPFGQLLCPDGLAMCGNGCFTIELTGVGGHASQPELCRDPVLAASAINIALQQILSRRLAPQRPAVVSVTSIEAPSAPTVIPQSARMGGSIRVSDDDSRREINQLITDIATHTAASYGVACTVDIQPRYHATINHPAPAQQVRRSWQHLHGEGGLRSDQTTPIMASEDFSYYLREIPGAFALIGADDGNDHHRPCHSPFYDFNDRLIPLVTALYATLVGIDAPSTTA